MTGSYPLLVLDLWEHAWYLKHKHNKAGYADDWWALLDWNKVSKHRPQPHSSPAPTPLKPRPQRPLPTVQNLIRLDSVYGHR